MSSRIFLDRGCFAGTLGAPTGELFLLGAEWRGMEQIPEVARARTGQTLTVRASAPVIGWPYGGDASQGLRQLTRRVWQFE